ncbi:MAG TPA: nucleotidyltransferase domain-containing protein [Candidatus Krumholzibacteria bacterium]|jgi:predicted nucleotidyltransferase
MTIAEIADRQSDLKKICREFGVKRLDVFGSAATGGFRSGESDLDFLVEFESDLVSADQYFGLLEALEDLFALPVDLVVASAIRNPYFKESVEETRTLLYAA